MKPNDKVFNKMKVFPKGQIVIPVSLRRKYNINIGDQIEFITIQDGILLKPSMPEKEDLSLANKLFGILRSYATKNRYPDKDVINKATENGFTDGWNK